MNNFIKRILKNSNEGDFISLAVADRTNNKFFPNMTSSGTNSRAMFVLNKNKYCNYISLNTFKDMKRTRNNISNLNGFMFDFDDGNIPNLVSNFIKTFGKPTWKITTTPSKGKTQLIYLFKEKENRLELWEKVSYTLTLWAKSDKQTWDLSRVFRFPLSVNGKNGEQTLVEVNENEYSIEYFLNNINNNKIDLLSPPEVKCPADSTKKKRGNSLRVKKPVNDKSLYYDSYNKFLLLKPSPSEARYSFILSMVRAKKNDKYILAACSDLNLDSFDCERILDKIRKR